MTIATATATVIGVLSALTASSLRAQEQQHRVLCVDATATVGRPDGSKQHPFQTIQAALAAASGGSEIRVAAGSYSGPVVIGGKNVLLLGGYKGSGDFDHRSVESHVTKITGTANTCVVQIRDSSGVSVAGFTVTGGRHGLELQSSSDVTVSENIIIGNGQPDGPAGGGIRLDGSRSIIISNNKIVSNQASDDGGGIGLLRGRKCEDITIRGNLVSGNSIPGEHGGGIFLEGTGVISDNIVADNGSCLNGGIFLNGGSIVCSGNVVRNNQNAGIFCIDYDRNGKQNSYVLQNNLIVGNTKEGIVSFWATIHVLNCTVADNGGAGFSRRDDPNMVVRIENSIFWHNEIDAPTGSVRFTCSDKSIDGVGNISSDPCFANGGQPAPDYHLRSRAGRWEPTQNGGKGGWVKDAIDSPGIDAGDPKASYNYESEPHGGRVNMGAYGNTAYASRSSR
jgi:parallel beta-helix repeat protein